MPARPEKVSGCPPQASPSRAISTRPRVIRLALALSPSPSPSTPPAASAITFFAAAQISTPTRSSFTYTRKTMELIASCRRSASSRSSLAITVADGSPCAISSAMFGPDSIATGRPGTRVDNRLPVPGSRPFVRISAGALPGNDAATSANARLGTASTISSASSIGAFSTVAGLTPPRSAVVR